MSAVSTKNMERFSVEFGGVLSLGLILTRSQWNVSKIMVLVELYTSG